MKYEMTALQAVRFLGELIQQHYGLTDDQLEHLAESTDLSLDEIEERLGAISNLWDDIKARTGSGAPEGDLSPVDMAMWLHQRLIDEALV